MFSSDDTQSLYELVIAHELSVPPGIFRQHSTKHIFDSVGGPRQIQIHAVIDPLCWAAGALNVELKFLELELKK